MPSSPSSPPLQGSVVCRSDAATCDDLDLKLSKSWLRIGIAAVFAGQGMVLSLALNMTPPPFGSTPYWVLHGGLILTTFVVLAFLGGPLFASTFRMLRQRRLSIEGLFTLSLLGALTGSLVGSVSGEGSVYYEIVSIVIAIYTFGRMLGERSQAKMLMEADRVRENLEFAQRVGKDGSCERVRVDDLVPGVRVRVGPGEVFTVDGRVLDGAGFVSETALTGEPTPVVRRNGDPVRAGTHAVDGFFEIEVTATGGAREIDRILAAVADPGGEPSDLQRQANRLTQFFLPIVALVSLLTAGTWWLLDGWQSGVLNSMAVLLVACPCALGLATPVAIWHGLYRLSQLGLVSRDGRLVDTLAATSHIFFDKTGTLSEEGLAVVECLVTEAWQDRRDQLFAFVAAIESRVAHPVAAGLLRYCEAQGVRESGLVAREIRVHSGLGLTARIGAGSQEVRVAIGDFDLDPEGREAAESALWASSGKRLTVFCEGRLAAVFVFREHLREGTTSLWPGLEQAGIRCTVLTGDPDPRVDLPVMVDLRSGLSAEAKAALVRASRDKGEWPLFVGDGINDTAAMAAASGSIAMSSGVSLARTTASAQLLNNRLPVLVDAVTLCRGIQRRLRGNLRYAAAYNVIGIGLAAAGWLHPIAAAAIMLVSSFFVTLRAMRSS